jgi:pSer/pThr/pTyr-binding forkhead associated (FHA) protein
VYPLRSSVMSVGRANANTLRIRDSRVAAHHVRIERDDTGFVLEVTADDAPTTLNGSELVPGDRRTLTDGDLIGLADLVFRFTDNHGDGVLGRLWVVAGVHRGKVFRIDSTDYAIGRATDNDVQFPDRSVSRHHCRIHKNDQAWWIEDLESTNGTILHGAPLQAPVRLEHGDEIVTGFSRFVFQEGDRPLVSLRLEPALPCN